MRKSASTTVHSHWSTSVLPTDPWICTRDMSALCGHFWLYQFVEKLWVWLTANC